jgi:hypothetical protein
MEEFESAFGIDSWVVVDPDPDLHRNPLRAVHALGQLDEELKTNRRPVADYTSTTIDVHAVGGTGFLLWRHIAEGMDLNGAIDWLVQSHRLQRAAHAGRDPAPRQQLLAALAYARIGPGSVLLDQPLRQYGYTGVPTRVARMLTTASHFDWTDFEHGIYSVGYDEVRLPFPHQGTSLANRCDATAAVARATSELEVQFDPAAWAFWRDDPATAPPTRGPSTVRVLVPHWIDDGEFVSTVADECGAGRTTEVVYADVDRVHLLTLRRLNDAWLEELRREAVDYVDNRINAGDNPVAAEWRCVCEQSGATHPVQRWDRYRARFVDPFL